MDRQLPDCSVSASAADFALPAAFHFTATFVLALTGALAASRRHYDIVGAFVLALVTGIGGSLLRDGLFLGVEPPLPMRDWRYIAMVVIAAVLGARVSHRLDRYNVTFNLLDAVGLAAYAVVGTQMALAQQLPVLAAVLVGTVSAVGGGLLRDVLAREEPLLFQPSQFYALVAAVGALVFVILQQAGLAGGTAGAVACVLIFALRVTVIRYDWRTRPVRPRD
jgi:uncharacterized membrane protein YeiH